VTAIRGDGHIVEKGRICPECSKKDTIIYWRRTGGNRDLFGNKIEDMVRIKPTCTACGTVFSKGTMFRSVR
jgi:Zn ribbon nucleic-acid-binding protein